MLTKFRTLTIVDVFSREALAIEVGQRLRGENVVEGNHPVVTAFRYNFMSLDWRQYCRR